VNSNLNLISIVFCAIMVVTSSVSWAYTYIDWTDEAGDFLWSSDNNWSRGHPPFADQTFRIGNTNGWIHIDEPAVAGDESRTGYAVNSTTRIYTDQKNLHIYGDLRLSQEATSVTYFDVRGTGSLYTEMWGGHIRVGHYGMATLSVSDSGTVTTDNDLILGCLAGSKGTVEQTGGTVSVGRGLVIGQDGANCQYNLDGGSLLIGERDSTLGLSIAASAGNNLNITEGTMRLVGDWVAEITSMYSDGRITAFGGAAELNIVCDDTYTYVSTYTYVDTDFTEPGEAPAVIMPDNVDIVNEFAAQELQCYLQKILSLDIDLFTESQFSGDSPAIHVGWTQKAQQTVPNAQNLKEDGFLLHRFGDEVFIVGSNKRGILYGVYGFLEDHLGCRWPEPDPNSEIVPKRDNLVLVDLEDTQESDMPVRGVMTSFGLVDIPDDMMQEVLDYVTWQARQRMNTFTIGVNPDEPASRDWAGQIMMQNNSQLLEHVQKRGFTIDNSTHSFRRFSGKSNRIDMSSISHKNLFVSNVNEMMENYSFFDVVGLWMSDGWDGATLNTPETCPLDDPPRYITEDFDWAAFEPMFCVTNTYVDFVNRIAAEVRQIHPDLNFSILAYNRSTLAPQYVVCLPGIRVHIAFRRAESYHIGDLNSEWNQLQNPELLNWVAASDHVVLYEYYIIGATGMLTRPWPRVISQDLAYLKSIGAEGTISQCNWDTFRNWGMNMYVYAKFSWDTTFDVNNVLQDYYVSVYGPAASAVSQMFNNWEAALNEGGDYFRGDYSAFMPLLTPDLRSSMKQNAADAVQLVNNNQEASVFNCQAVSEIEIIANAVDQFCNYVVNPSSQEKDALLALEDQYEFVYFNFKQLEGSILAGDFDHDWDVDMVDLGLLTDHWLVDFYSELPNDLNLRAHYDFEDAGGNVVTDSSGNGFDAFIVNFGDGSWSATGGFDGGGCLQFSNTAVDSDIAIFDNLDGDVTFSLWVDVDTTVPVPVSNYVFYTYASTVGIVGNQSEDDANAITVFSCGFGDDTNTSYQCSETDPNFVGWHHYAFTKKVSTNTERIYRDGILIAERNNADDPIDYLRDGEPMTFSIGHYNTGSGSRGGYFFGKIDDFRVYDYELSQSEILSLAGELSIQQPLVGRPGEIDDSMVNDGIINFLDFARMVGAFLE
jgi:T5SS/PEP-CTERM-associated repeat protein